MGNSSERPFIELEEVFIRENYKTMTCREIGAKLGRPRNSIASKAKRMGLFKRRGFAEKERGFACDEVSRVDKCLWPSDDCACDKQPVSGKPYCAEHCAIAYVKVPRLVVKKQFIDPISRRHKW